MFKGKVQILLVPCFSRSKFTSYIPKGACSSLPVDPPSHAEKVGHQLVFMWVVKLFLLVFMEHFAGCRIKVTQKGEMILLRNL